MSTVAAPLRRVPLLRRRMPASLLSRELLVTAARPRALLIKVVVPLLLTVPLLVAHAPTFWAAMLLTVLTAMIGAVGSAVTIARAREHGLLLRLSLSPRAPWRSVLGWVTGAVIVDFLQLVPMLVALFLLAPVTPRAALAVTAVVIAVLLLANALGSVVSVLGGGPGEVLVDVAVVLAPLLFLGGLFTGVPHEGWRATAAQYDPFSYAHAAFIGALGGAPSFGVREILLASALTTGAALLLVTALARPVLRRR